MGLPRQSNTTPDGVHVVGSGAMLYTVAEAGALLRISTRSVWRRVAAGMLEVVRLSDRSTRVTGESLRAYVRLGRDVQVRKDIAATTPVTHGTINRIAVEYAEKHGPEKVIALMTRYGVKHLGDLKAEQLEPFQVALLKL